MLDACVAVGDLKNFCTPVVKRHGNRRIIVGPIVMDKVEWRGLASNAWP